ncbi:cyclodeaminase/cyclohydrolase family protein [Deinococcus sonorensis]|uniref:Cyclodeaminase/cyclohydrolase family protein n=2 Tax=Deinococcus sonorensis TaxID=309891 RepID=A0AAU7UD21_9DEIO
MSVWEQSAAALLRHTASAEPTPGGGSVAALTGTFGLGLVIMGLELSARRPDADAGVAPLLAETRALLTRLEAHPDADVAAFQGYIAALDRPKASDEEKAQRREAIRQAARQATEAPLSAARDLLGALRLAERAAPLTHRTVVSDVGAGAHLIHGALHATLLNVDINLGSLPEPERAAAHQERVQLAEQATGLGQQVTAAVARQLA